MMSGSHSLARVLSHVLIMVRILLRVKLRVVFRPMVRYRYEGGCWSWPSCSSGRPCKTRRFFEASSGQAPNSLVHPCGLTALSWTLTFLRGHPSFPGSLVNPELPSSLTHRPISSRTLSLLVIVGPVCPSACRGP